MEFPDMGKQCAVRECNQLDFLPIKCIYCKKSFCTEHSKPDDHTCADAPTGDGARVPVCPLCKCPVPVNKGENPNIRMERHIAANCSERSTSTSTKPFNSCSFGSCKARVAVRLECQKCHKTYCIKHRHESDHRCRGQQQQQHKPTLVPAKIAAGNAAAARQQQQKPTVPVSPKSPKAAIKSFVGKLFGRKSSSRK